VNQVAVVLAASALRQYARGPVEGLAVAELISEVRDEGRQVAISAVSLAQAIAVQGPDRGSFGLALLEWFTSDGSDFLVVEMALEQVLPVGNIARDFGIEVALAHEVLLATRFNAQFATTEPDVARRVLGDDWPILDVTQGPFS